MSDKSILEELERLAAHHEQEGRRYRAAVLALTGRATVEPPTASHPSSRATTTPRKKGPTSTMSMIRKVLGESHEPLAVAELTELMLSGGWETMSEVPTNTVRTALMRLVDRDEVRRFEDGTYTLGTRAALRAFTGGPEPDDDDDTAE